MFPCVEMLPLCFCLVLLLHQFGGREGALRAHVHVEVLEVALEQEQGVLDVRPQPAELEPYLTWLFHQLKNLDEELKATLIRQAKK